MLFNSYGFIFLLLPLCLTVFTFANRWFGARGGVTAIVLGSLAFYASWDPRFLMLLLLSVGLNFGAGLLIADASMARQDRSAGRWFGIGVTANLLLLGWYKYAGFLASSLNVTAGLDLPILNTILPLGISFFTFEQIGYLVDVRRGGAAERNIIRFGLFVMFFPRLVAGPILRLSELLPQVPRAGKMSQSATDIAVGGTLFALGLAKKAFLADGVAPYATGVFTAAGHGASLPFAVAWAGTLAYTLQIYFDFSGYSDMAIGLARMFGLRFPSNFNSPYKSRSIVEFWRRWHMTLSRFLRDYLYISLGGNRHGHVRRYMNLFLTMVLGGPWHGANWTFVAWGALHGLYLIINHGFTLLCRRSPQLATAMASGFGQMICWATTMLGVIVGWVFFRAATFEAAEAVLGGMFSFRAVAGVSPVDLSGAWIWIVSLSLIALLAPNTQEILCAWKPVLEDGSEQSGHHLIRWRPGFWWGVATAGVALAGFMSISNSGEFLYWQF